MGDSLSGLFEGYREGFALPGAVYKDPEIYEPELRRIFLKSWHYVGHVSQVREKGDYFLFEIADESVIIVRDGEGAMNALLNVCRHRGSRICDAQPAASRASPASTTAGPTRSTARCSALGFAPEGIDKSQPRP